jgi:hypothetical protein
MLKWLLTKFQIYTLYLKETKFRQTNERSRRKKKIFDKSMKKTRYRSSKLISMKRKPKNQDSHDRYEKWRKMFKNKYEVGSIETDQISQKEETPI